MPLKIKTTPDAIRRQIERASLVAGDGNSTKSRKKASALKPEYDHITIHAENGKLYISAVDMDLHTVSDVSINAEEDGTVRVHADKFQAVLKQCYGDADITLEAKDEKIIIKQGEFKVSLPTYTAEPSALSWTDPKDCAACFVLTESMIEAIVKVNACLDPEPRPDNKYAGVLIDLTRPGEVWFVAFGVQVYYLARFALDHGCHHRMVIQGRAVPILATAPAGTIMGLDPAHSGIVLEGPGFSARFVALEDQYPLGNYIQSPLSMHKMGDKQYPITVKDGEGKPMELPRYPITISTADFLDGLAKASVALLREDNCVQFTVEGQTGDQYVIALKGLNKHSEGSSQAKVLATCPEPLPGEIKTGMNWAYVRDIVKNLGGDKVTFYIRDQHTPFVVIREDRHNVAVISIPLRLD
jgi:hypothetical protein